MSVYKLQASGSGGTEDAIAMLDIQFDGVIQAIHASVKAVLDAASEFVQAEVSFLSVSTINSNDSRGSIHIVQGQASIGAAGAAFTGINSGVGPTDIPVSAGERLFLHILASAGVISTVQFHLHVRDTAATGLRRRR